MATFTMVLKDVLDIESDVGLSQYPIFDESYREGLNQKILDHYWNQEIGQETIELFKLALRRKMNEIMPYYNQHYIASRLEFDPLETVNIKNVAATTSNTTEGSTTNTEYESNATNSSTSDAKSRSVTSETPQTRLAGNEDYATAAQDNASETTAGGTSSDNSTTGQTGNTTTDQTGNQDGSTIGFSGSYAATLMELRASFVNVDMMVINELSDLFMLVWDNGDAFSERQLGYGYFGYGFPFYY